MARLLPVKTSAVREFVGGIDPFGIWTTQQAAERERQGQSHGIGRTAALAGGIVGGGVLVPSAISGASAAFGGGSFMQGAQQPWRRLHQGFQLRNALQGGRWGDVASLLSRRGSGPPSISGAMNFLRNFNPSDVPTQGLGGAASRSVGRMMRPGLAGIGLGALIGGGGALLQYNKGVASERQTQGRIQSALGDQSARFQTAMNPQGGMMPNRQPPTGLPPAYGHAFGKYSSLSLSPRAGFGGRRSQSSRNYSAVNRLGAIPLNRLRQRLTVSPKRPTIGQRGIGIRPK